MCVSTVAPVYDGGGGVTRPNRLSVAKECFFFMKYSEPQEDDKVFSMDHQSELQARRNYLTTRVHGWYVECRSPTLERLCSPACASKAAFLVPKHTGKIIGTMPLYSMQVRKMQAQKEDLHLLLSCPEQHCRLRSRVPSCEGPTDMQRLAEVLLPSDAALARFPGLFLNPFVAVVQLEPLG